ncbi:MAG TPA: energy transducer TonB [Candidatus Sulfopaludibacter sp.]|nr:energy transducer TonB [Candidatus Sulfopaludibacter sp.]
MTDPFLENRVHDLVATAERHMAAGSFGAARDGYLTALAAVEDALSQDPSNEGAARLWRQLAEALERVPAVTPAELPHPPSFQLLKAGDVPRSDYLRAMAAVLAVCILAVAVRVSFYYATHHVDLGPNPLEQKVQFAPPARPPADPNAGPADDTVYFPDPGVTLPVLRSKSEPLGSAPGKVVVLAVIDQDGRPVSARIWHGLSADLNTRAIEAAGKWRFRPGMRDGRPFPVMAQLEITFRQQ